MTIETRLHSIGVHAVPPLAACFVVVRKIYFCYQLQDMETVL